MRNFLIGAAAIAMAATGAFADPGKGKGNDGDKGGHAAAMELHGKGNAKHDKGPSMKAAKVDKDFAKAGKEFAKADKAHAKAAKEHAKVDKAYAKADEKRAKAAAKEYDKADKRYAKALKERDRDYRRDGFRDGRTVSFDRASYGLVEGCPPGLAKKNNGCMPPGLAKKRAGWSDEFDRPSWFGYGSLGDGRYRYDDGYLYRMNDQGSILGYLPLLGGALSIGNTWPSFYQPASVPDYYVDYYDLGSPNGYRYADDVLYRVDPQSSAITSIAALLTGDQFAVGQPVPSGYDVYNVPYSYRDRYADSADAHYRYSDGYVYEIDPTTQLVAAAIQLLT